MWYTFTIVKKGCLLFFGCLLFSMGQAQVSNDNIENRRILTLNVPVQSNTTGSTVQWNCLNQALTRSCLKYHNDQWFSFQVPDSGKYYINLNDQDCKDVWGVQVLIFAGQPCMPATYELITCYSEGNQDDVFITVEGLRPGEEYLLNIDGYLNDFCGFQLALSDRPQGLPVEVEERGTMQTQVDLRLVSLSWTMPDSLAGEIGSFEVWKNTGAKSVLLVEVPHVMNALGESRRAYDYLDTLYETHADYSVIATGNGNRLLIARRHVALDKTALADAPENVIEVPLDYNKGDDLTLELWDVEGDARLFTKNIEFDGQRNGVVKFRVMTYRDRGITFFKVIIKNHHTRKSELRFFEK